MASAPHEHGRGLRMTIRLKLLLGIGIPYLALAAIAVAWDYSRQKAAAFDDAQQHLADVAGRGAAQLDGFFRAAAGIARTAADVTSARGIPADEEIYAMLVELLERNGELYGACFAMVPEALPAGRTRFAPYVCRDGEGLRSMDLSTAYDYTLPGWDWYDRPVRDGAPWWTEPYFDEGAGNAAMVTCAVPVRAGAGTVAVQTIDIRLEELQRRLAIPTGLDGATWIILSRNGTFVSVSDESLLLTTTIFDLAARRSLPDLEALGRRMVAGEHGFARYREAGDAPPRLASFEPIPSTGWSFAMHVSEAAVVDPVYAALRLRFAAASLVSLLLLGVVLGVAFWISRPIPRLTAAVRELSAGRLDARVGGAQSRDEFGELAAGFNRMVEELERHIDRLTSETAARERVESELRVAREIQLSLLPGTFPAFPGRPEFDLHAANAAARSIAGDFFDFELVAPDLLYFVIADVSGKGIPAALFMAVTRTLLRNVNRTAASPADMLRIVNRALVQENHNAMFVTVFVGLYEVDTGRVRYANAGHPPPRLLRADGSLRAFGDESGALLGILPDETWPDGQDVLAPGDALVLYTDGVTEARADGRALYGMDRLDKVLRTTPGKPAQEIIDAVVADVARYEAGHVTDDVTLLVLRRQ
jgi:sigma-B regulation protein RsbU (phosphoserine phosphatase)